MAEETQFAQILGHLAVTLGGLLEVANGPDDGEEDGRTADEVDDDEDLIPGGETHGTLLGLADDYGGDVGKHLEREG